MEGHLHQYLWSYSYYVSICRYYFFNILRLSYTSDYKPALALPLQDRHYLVYCLDWVKTSISGSIKEYTYICSPSLSSKIELVESYHACHVRLYPFIMKLLHNPSAQSILVHSNLYHNIAV